MKPILATYETTCELCGRRILEEDPIVCVEDEWVHVQCAEDEGYEVQG